MTFVWMAKNEWAGALESSNASGEKSEETKEIYMKGFL